MERIPASLYTYRRKVVRLIRPILTWFPPFLFSLFSIRFSMNRRMYNLIISFVMATIFTSFHGIKKGPCGPYTDISCVECFSVSPLPYRPLFIQ